MWDRFTGWLGRVFYRPAMLKAREEPFSVIGFLLIVVQSAALVLVFGHTEIFRLFSRDITQVAVAGVSLFILVVSTYAIDITARKAISRVGPLRRMQEEATAAWLTAYVAFVLLVEGGTFAVALYAVEQRPDALFSQAPILPNSGIWLFAQIGLRAMMLSLTFVMLQVVASKLPLGYEVAISDARARVGGMMRETLAEAHLEAQSLGDLMTAWGRLNIPMPRKRTRWNAGAIARDEEYAQRLHAQTASIVEAFTQLTHDRTAEAQDTAARAIEQAHEQATQRATAAVLALVTGGTLPDWLVKQHPELEGFTLAQIAGGNGRGRGGSRDGSYGVAAPSSQASSPAGRQRAFLARLGIEAGKAPEGKRGVWLTAAQVETLTAGHASATETHQALVRRLGNGAKIGLALAAPFDAVMRELAERRLLTADAAAEYVKLAQSGDAAADASATGVSEDSGEQPIPLPFPRRA